MTNPNTRGSRAQTRSSGGQTFAQSTPGHVAPSSGGGLAAVSPSRLENPPHFDENGEYDPGDLKEIDKAIRHLPGVVQYMVRKANECIEETGSENFEVVLQNRPDTQRPRAYVAPANNQGIHEELSEHVLLKAAINMAGR